MRKYWLLQGILLLLAAFPFSATADSSLSDTDAQNLLRERLVSDHLYAKMECIMFFIEEQNPQELIFGLREIHNENCGGDPDISPTIDRYRLTRSSKKIEWYDVIEDDYQPYSEAVKRRKRK